MTKIRSCLQHYDLELCYLLQVVESDGSIDQLWQSLDLVATSCSEDFELSCVRWMLAH